MLTPWLVGAFVPAHGEATLRWATHYERSWMVVGVKVQAHLRLDEDLNAWLIEAGPPKTVYLINVSSAIQLLLEVASLLSICTILWAAARAEHRTHRVRTAPHA